MSTEAKAMVTSFKEGLKDIKANPVQVFSSPVALRTAVTVVASSQVPKLEVATSGRVTEVVGKVAKYMSGDFTIGPKTLLKVTKHLEQFGVKAENSIMLERMKQIAKKQMKATEIDINFAKHELREMELQAEYMKEGMSQADAQQKAHWETLEEQDMAHRNYEQKLYTPEAIEAGNKQLYDEQK